MENDNEKVLRSGLNIIHLIVSIIAISFVFIFPPLSIGLGLAGVLIYLFLCGAVRSDSIARKIAFTSFIISLVAVLLSTFILLGLLTFKTEVKNNVEDYNAVEDAGAMDRIG